MSKTCCGFGHRQVIEDIKERLDEAIENAINDGCEIFYTGAMGDFDRLFSSVVLSKKRKNQNIKLICIKPYLTKGLQENKEIYYSEYDDIIIPTELADIHYKSIISKRNEWMINNSDVVIIYKIRDFGGAYQSLKYAEKNKKIIIMI